MPWLLSGVGYGVLLDDSEPSSFALQATHWTATVQAAHLDFEEFRASYESLTLALASHVRELAACCVPAGTVTGTHRAAATPTEAR